jgi:hypothetical protein
VENPEYITKYSEMSMIMPEKLVKHKNRAKESLECHSSL